MAVDSPMSGGYGGFMEGYAMKAILSLTAAATTALAIACGGGDGEERVSVSLAEWTVIPSPSSVSPGDVTFRVTNGGEEPHEFVVIRSDLAPDALPVDADGKVPEDEIELVDEIEPFGADTTEDLTLDLQPGNYVLICNIVEFPPDEEPESHYLNGMRAAFTVE
jgi:uncharacterized cupredoxin-like copper-binding protein